MFIWYLDTKCSPLSEGGDALSTQLFSSGIRLKDEKKYDMRRWPPLLGEVLACKYCDNSCKMWKYFALLCWQCLIMFSCCEQVRLCINCCLQGNLRFLDSKNHVYIVSYRNTPILHPDEQTVPCKDLVKKCPKFPVGKLNFSAGKILGIFHLSRDFINSSWLLFYSGFPRYLNVYVQLVFPHYCFHWTLLNPILQHTLKIWKLGAGQRPVTIFTGS